MLEMDIGEFLRAGPICATDLNTIPLRQEEGEGFISTEKRYCSLQGYTSDVLYFDVCVSMCIHTFFVLPVVCWNSNRKILPFTNSVCVLF